MNFQVFLLMVLLLVQAPGLAAEAKELHEEAMPVFVRSTLSLYDPPTCQLNNKNGSVHQVLCYGETFKIKATSSDENAAVQWFRQNNTGNWVAVTGGTNVELTTGKGIYKAIFTFSDSSTCETETDTIDYWKAYQIDWNVAACRAQIASVTPLPFPTQLDGAGEVSTPVNPEAEINYNWQVIPEPVQASFSTSSNSIFPLTDGYFTDSILGLHKVILTVSQQGSACISVDTMEVTLLTLTVWADTIISYGGQPAIAVAHASGGTEPYVYSWSTVDTCLTSGCDSVVVSNFSSPVAVTVMDEMGCGNNLEIHFNQMPEIIEYAIATPSYIQCHLMNVKGRAEASHFDGQFFPPQNMNTVSSTASCAYSYRKKEIDNIVIEGGFVPASFASSILLEDGKYISNTDSTLTDSISITLSDDEAKIVIVFQNDIYIGNTFRLLTNHPENTYLVFMGSLTVDRNAVLRGNFFSYESMEIRGNKISGSFFAQGQIVFTNTVEHYTNAFSQAELRTFTMFDQCSISPEPNLLCNSGFEEISENAVLPVSGAFRVNNAKKWSGFQFGYCFTAPDGVEEWTIPNDLIGSPGISVEPRLQTSKAFLGAFITNSQTTIPTIMQRLNTPILQSSKVYYFEVYGRSSKAYIRYPTTAHLTADENYDHEKVINMEKLANAGSWQRISDFFTTDEISDQTISFIDFHLWRENLAEITDQTQVINPADYKGHIFLDDASLYEVPNVISPGCRKIISNSEITLSVDMTELQIPVWETDGLLQASWNWYKLPTTGTDPDPNYTGNIVTISGLSTTTTFRLELVVNDMKRVIGEVTIEVLGGSPLSFDVLSEPFCPGKNLTFQVSEPHPIENATYAWVMQGQNASYTGMVVNNISWPDPGSYLVTLIMTPNDPSVCPATYRRTILIENPTVSILSKNHDSPIVLCPEISAIDLEVAAVVGATSYVWTTTFLSDPGLIPHDNPNEVTANLIPPNGNLPGSTTVGITISPYMGCASATGSITIIRKPDYFEGSPGFVYDDPVTGNPSSVNPVEMCSGNTVTLSPGSGITYSGPASFEYHWTGPGIPSFATGSVTVGNLPPGTYVFQVQAVETDGTRCGSEFTTVTVIINDPHTLTVTPVPISGYPNDFRLQADFDLTGVSAFLLRNEDEQTAEAFVASPTGPQLIDLYTPGNPATDPLADGKYAVYISYSDGCLVREPFTLIGEKSLETVPATYQQNLTLSGTVYMHHDVTFNPGTTGGLLKFINADVYVRGDVGADGSGFNGQVVPGTVHGSTLSVSGQNTTLIINTSRFQAVLDRMWGGIRVNGVQNFYMGLPDPNAEGTEVSDALVGLEIGSTDIGQMSNITHVTFTNCHTGLSSLSSRVNAYTFANTITGCLAQCDPHGMKIPYQTRTINGVSQTYPTQTGFHLGGGSHYPVKIHNPGNTPVFTFSQNRAVGCFHGMVVGLTDAGRQVVAEGCTLTNNRKAGLVAYGGLQQVVNCRFELPAEVNATGNHYLYSQPVEPVSGIEGHNTGFEALRNRFGQADPETENRIGVFMQQDEATTQTLMLTGNTFTDLATSISLNRIGEEDPATLNFTLRCNRFRLSCAEENVLLTAPDPCAATGIPERRGLVIGEGVRVNSPGGGGPGSNQIGGTSTFNTAGQQYPNANEWPVRAGIDRTTLPSGVDNIQDLPWEMPANWISMDNNDNNPEITYHRYFNEFLIDQVIEETGSLNFVSVAADPSVRMTASTGTNPGELACEGFDIDDVDVFPLRVAVMPDSANLLTGTRSLDMAAPWLSEAFPNPSAGEARIKAFIPKEEPFVVLQIVDLGTGKVLSGKVLEERGHLELIVDCSKAASGTYGYQVLLGKKLLGMKKLVIIK